MISGISYSNVEVTTILWTDRGFTTSPDIVSVVRQLIKELNNHDTIKLICKRFDIKDGNDDARYHFDNTVGIEHITLVRIRNFTLNSMKIETLTIRIYICDNALGMKAKITATLSIGHNPEWTSSETSNILSNIYSLGEMICRFVQSMIPKRFDLGDINCICNISGIESCDSQVDELLDSMYNPTTGHFEVKGKSEISEAHEGKISESYYVLMSKPNSGLEKIHDDRLSVTAAMKKYAVKQIKYCIRQPHHELQAKTLNFELLEEDRPDMVPHRIISNLTKSHCGQVIVRSLITDYLNIT